MAYRTPQAECEVTKGEVKIETVHRPSANAGVRCHLEMMMEIVKMILGIWNGGIVNENPKNSFKCCFVLNVQSNQTSNTLRTASNETTLNISLITNVKSFFFCPNSIKILRNTLVQVVVSCWPESILENHKKFNLMAKVWIESNMICA